jgi:mannose-6-phosphate isomerase-like protein (cupin superfamily)
MPIAAAIPSPVIDSRDPATADPDNSVAAHRAAVCATELVTSLRAAEDGHYLFVGSEHGGLAVSVAVFPPRSAARPAPRRLPYAQVFVVDSGAGTFRVGDDIVAVAAGQLVAVPPNTAHGVVAAGDEPLRLTVIHAAAPLDDAWLEGAA